MEIKRLLNTDEGQEKLVNDLQRIITAHYETKRFDCTFTSFWVKVIIKFLNILIFPFFNFVFSTDQTKKPIINPKHLKFILHKLQNRIYRLEDLVTKNYICLWFWDNNVLLTEKKQIEMLEKFLLKIDSMEWEVESVKNFIRQFAKENEFNFVEFMKLLRLTLIEVKV